MKYFALIIGSIASGYLAYLGFVTGNNDAFLPSIVLFLASLLIGFQILMDLPTKTTVITPSQKVPSIMKAVVSDNNGEQGSKMRERFFNGLNDAISSQGKNKGKLKRQCPPMNTDGAAVWQGLMFHANPYKLGTAHLLLMDNDTKQLYQYVCVMVSRLKVDVRHFDTDRIALESFNIW